MCQLNWGLLWARHRAGSLAALHKAPRKGLLKQTESKAQGDKVAGSGPQGEWW